MAAVASRREEQYAQLNPYRFALAPALIIVAAAPPPLRGEANGFGALTARGTPASAVTISCAGTFSVDMQLGHRTAVPACDSCADNFVPQIWQSNTIMSQ